jgi:signal transduction histidine kinase
MENYLLVGVGGRLEIPYNFREHDLLSVLRDCIQWYGLDAAKRGMEIKLVAPGVEGIPIVCDRDRLEQVFSNLLDNAVKYGFEFEPVKVEVRDRGWVLSVRISDRGLGVPRSAYDLIFQGFQRAVDDKRRFKPGTGLGLRIAKEIVKRHRGEVVVESVPYFDDPARVTIYEGYETTFTVTLPKRPEPAARQ